MNPEEKSCANHWCSCTVHDHDEFCSPACAEQAAEGLRPPCNCVHEGCAGTVPQSLREG